MELRYEIVVWEGERRPLTVNTLAAVAGLHPELVERFVDFGLIEPVDEAGDGGEPLFDVSAVTRLRAIERLRKNTGANLHGVAVILDLVEKLRDARHENERLRGLL